MNVEREIGFVMQLRVTPWLSCHFSKRLDPTRAAHTRRLTRPSMASRPPIHRSTRESRCRALTTSSALTKTCCLGSSSAMALTGAHSKPTCLYQFATSPRLDWLSQRNQVVQLDAEIISLKLQRQHRDPSEADWPMGQSLALATRRAACTTPRKHHSHPSD